MTRKVVLVSYENDDFEHFYKSVADFQLVEPVSINGEDCSRLVVESTVYDREDADSFNHCMARLYNAFGEKMMSVFIYTGSIVETVKVLGYDF